MYNKSSVVYHNRSCCPGLIDCGTWAGEPFEDDGPQWVAPTSGIVVSTELPSNILRKVMYKLDSGVVHSPYSNPALHNVEPYTTWMPSDGYMDTNLHGLVHTLPDGFKYITIAPTSGRFRYVWGLPSNRHVISAQADHSDLANAAIDVLTGHGMDATLQDLVLQLLELKDLPELIRSIKGLMSLARDVSRGKVGALINIREIAQQYLAIQYGYLPTLQQVEYFFRDLSVAVAGFKSRLQHLKDLRPKFYDPYGKPKFLSCRRKILSPIEILSANGLPRAVADFLPTAPQKIQFTRTFSPTGFSGEPHWKQFQDWANSTFETAFWAFPDEDLVYSQFSVPALFRVDILNQLMSMLWDILSPFSNAWAITKLSFVLDWFVGVQDVFYRLDNLVSSSLLEEYGVSPVDPQPWRSRRWRPFLATNAWEHVAMNEEVIPHFELHDGVEYMTSCEVVQTFSNTGRMFPFTYPEGKYYRRDAFTLSLWDIVLPKYNINLNLSKTISSIALALGFTS